MKAKDGEPAVLMLPIRSPGKASVGSLSRLWAEFTDPGPAGDSLNILKKYAGGIVPGCMGLLFMAVGILVIVLFSRQIILADKKTYLPLVFGTVFALAGFLVAYFGGSSVLRTAGGTAPRGREPWTSDNAWNPRGALPDNPTGTFASFLGRVVFFLFIGLLNILWTVKMDWTGRAIVSVILVVFDLLALAILYDSFQKILQKIRIGTPRLEWQKFPFFTGSRFDAVFRAGRAMRATGPPQVTLRRVEQRSFSERRGGATASGMRATEAWSAKKTIAALGAESVTSFPISFDIPEGEPGTDLSRDDCVYWQVAVAVPVTGPDVEAVFLVPIYARPK